MPANLLGGGMIVQLPGLADGGARERWRGTPCRLHVPQPTILSCLIGGLLIFFFFFF